MTFYFKEEMCQYIKNSLIFNKGNGIIYTNALCKKIISQAQTTKIYVIYIAQILSAESSGIDYPTRKIVERRRSE